MTKVEHFFADFTKLIYDKGEVILRAEDSPPGVYYLKKGLVRQYILSSQGDAFIVHIFKPGSFFPMMWAINHTPNRYYFDALSSAELQRAPKEAVVAFLKKNPEILFDLTSRILAGLGGLLTRIEHLVLDSAYSKTALLLLYFARNFGRTDRDGLRLEIPLAHREIAAWIGTTRETASLQMEALKRKGVIATRGRQIIISDLTRLEKEAALLG